MRQIDSDPVGIPLEMHKQSDLISYSDQSCDPILVPIISNKYNIFTAMTSKANVLWIANAWWIRYRIDILFEKIKMNFPRQSNRTWKKYINYACSRILLKRRLKRILINKIYTFSLIIHFHQCHWKRALSISPVKAFKYEV